MKTIRRIIQKIQYEMKGMWLVAFILLAICVSAWISTDDRPLQPSSGRYGALDTQ